MKVQGSAAYDVGQLMALGSHELVLLVFVLEIGEGGFDAGTTDQALVTLLVAGVVARQITGTIRGRLASRGRLARRLLGYFGGRTIRERRPDDDYAQRDQRQSGQNAERQQPPLVETCSHVPSSPINPRPPSSGRWVRR